jgi:MFS family permease
MVSLGIMTLFAGLYTDKVNRVRFIAAASILWSLSSVFAGGIDSFEEFVIMRIFLGVFSAVFKPASYSLLKDYFDEDQRSTAFSWLHTALYFGNTLAIFSQFII